MYTNTDWNRYVTGNVMDVYGTNASAYCEMPNQLQRENGVIPLDSLPAQWWNALWNMVTTKVTGALSTSLTSIREELASLVTNNGICLDSSNSSQVYCAIELMTQRLATDSIAGAIKSSSTCGKISVCATTGVATANGLGDISQACTTAKTSAVAAINELVACDSCLRTDIDNIEAGIGSGINVYCAGTCKCTIDSNTALCLCRQAFQPYADCILPSTMSGGNAHPFLTVLATGYAPEKPRYTCSAYICTTSNGDFCWACIPTICGTLYGCATCAGTAVCACGAVCASNATNATNATCASSATNSTCFNGCTFAQTCTAIRSGLTSCTGTVTVSNSTSSNAVPITLCTGTTAVGRSTCCTLTFTPTTGQLTTNANVCIISTSSLIGVTIGASLSGLTNAAATVGTCITNATYGVAVGSTITNAGGGVAIGEVVTNAVGGVAVGSHACVEGACGIGIGYAAIAAACGIGIGYAAIAAACGIGIGYAARACSSGIAIGCNAAACTGIAIGCGAHNLGFGGAIIIGNGIVNCDACGVQNVLIGNSSVSCSALNFNHQITRVGCMVSVSWGTTASCNVWKLLTVAGFRCGFSCLVAGARMGIIGAMSAIQMTEATYCSACAYRINVAYGQVDAVIFCCTCTAEVSRGAIMWIKQY